MIFINIVFFLLICMLAIISRKNYSKYKNEGHIKGLFLSMGETIYAGTGKLFAQEKISSDFRKINIVSEANIKLMTHEYMVKNAAICLVVGLVFNLISACSCILYRYLPQSSDNIIERAGYQGDIEPHDIYMSVDGETSVYVLQVSPVIYTKQEFKEQLERVYLELAEAMPEDNESLDSIYTDILLKSSDSTGAFDISWHSDYPEYVTSYGKVNRDGLEQDMEVLLTADVTYQDYSDSLSYTVTLKADKGNDENNIDIVMRKLKEIEGNDREKQFIRLPDEVDGVSISLSPERKNKALYIMIFAIPACVLSAFLGKSRMMEKIKERDNMLRVLYPIFVNRLYLLLGTGMTLKNSMRQIVDDTDNNILTKELSYTLREMDAGKDEAYAYEQLGCRLALPQYVRIMNHISQNLRLGTRDLRAMMEEEVHMSVNDRIEYAKKKGEEASTKLLIPMIILLAIVLVIIMIPAVMKF